MSSPKLTNRELIAFRKRMKIRELAIAEIHERTHTGTAVHRRLQMPEDPAEIPWPTPADTAEGLERQLEVFLSGPEVDSRQEPHRKAVGRSKAYPATPVAAPHLERLQAILQESGQYPQFDPKPPKRPGKD